MSRNLFNTLSVSSIGTPSIAPDIPQFYYLGKPAFTPPIGIGYTGYMYSEMANLQFLLNAGEQHYINIYMATSSITSSYSLVGTASYAPSFYLSQFTTASITGLTPNTTYYFKIRAVNTSSNIIIESADSAIMTGTTAPYITASGGTTVTADGFRTHTFTSNGTLTVTRGGSGVHVIAIGGGGGGGVGIDGAIAGGGGGGGYTYESGSFFLLNGTYNVIVGSGGSKGTYYFDEENQQDVLNNDETDGGVSIFTGSVITQTINHTAPRSASGDFGRKGGSTTTIGSSGGRAGNRIINGINLTPTFYSGGLANGVYGGGGGGAGGYGGTASVSANGTGGAGVTFFGTTYATGSAGGSNTNGHNGVVIIRYKYVP